MFWVKTRNNQMVPMPASLRSGLGFSFWKIGLPPTYGLKHAAACRSTANFSWGPLMLGRGACGSPLGNALLWGMRSGRGAAVCDQVSEKEAAYLAASDDVDVLNSQLSEKETALQATTKVPCPPPPHPQCAVQRCGPEMGHSCRYGTKRLQWS